MTHTELKHVRSIISMHPLSIPTTYYILFLCVAQSCLFLLSPSILLTEVEVLLSVGGYIRLFALSFQIFQSYIMLHNIVLFPFLFFYPASLSLRLPLSLFKSFLGNDFCKSTNECGLKTDAVFVLHEKRDGSFTVMGSATISGAGVTDLDVFKGRFHGVDPNAGSGSGLIVMKQIVILNESLPVLYLYGFHCLSNDDLPEALGGVSRYNFHLWGSQLMKTIGNKNQGSSSRSIFEQDGKDAEGQGGDDIEFVKVLVTDRADAVSDKNGIAVKVRLLNVSEYHQATFL